MSGEFLNQEEIDALLGPEQAELLIKTNKKADTAPRTLDDKGTANTMEVNPESKSEKNELLENDLDDKLGLILDIPLTVSVILGKTVKPIQEILCFQSGSIIELNSIVDEDVDIVVNNVLVAQGEVVVINDNFGVRITNILNTTERMLQLKRGVV